MNWLVLTLIGAFFVVYGVIATLVWNKVLTGMFVAPRDSSIAQLRAGVWWLLILAAVCVSVVGMCIRAVQEIQHLLK